MSSYGAGVFFFVFNKRFMWTKKVSVFYAVGKKKSWNNAVRVNRWTRAPLTFVDVRACYRGYGGAYLQFFHKPRVMLWAIYAFPVTTGKKFDGIPRPRNRHRENCFRTARRLVISDNVSTVRDARFATYFFYLKAFADCEQLMIYSHGQNVLTVYVL